MGADAVLDPDLVTVDAARNRVYLHFRGFLTKTEVEKLREAYRNAIEQVGRGYTAVSIFEDFMPGTPEAQEVISSMIQMADEGGCRAAARVAQGSVFGQMQLGRLQRQVSVSYPVHDCETVAEADAHLDGI
jgi:hypothetical protein